ncbi:MAG: LysM peptidoglycan-binding domain-containing protein [Firmicutes bacterium]|nr:LysM peptidoglycan-binding domain-containing protein [Bacillota bacterium]
MDEQSRRNNAADGIDNIKELYNDLPKEVVELLMRTHPLIKKEQQPEEAPMQDTVRYAEPPGREAYRFAEEPAREVPHFNEEPIREAPRFNDEPLRETPRFVEEPVKEPVKETPRFVEDVTQEALPFVKEPARSSFAAEPAHTAANIAGDTLRAASDAETGFNAANNTIAQENPDFAQNIKSFNIEDFSDEDIPNANPEPILTPPPFVLDEESIRMRAENRRREAEERVSYVTELDEDMLRREVSLDEVFGDEKERGKTRSESRSGLGIVLTIVVIAIIAFLGYKTVTLTTALKKANSQLESISFMEEDYEEMKLANLALEEELAQLKSEMLNSQTVVPTQPDTAQTLTPEQIPGPAGQQQYTVQAGDSFWKIADKFYGNGSMYNLILEANGMDENTSVREGMVLIIPAA